MVPYYCSEYWDIWLSMVIRGYTYRYNVVYACSDYIHFLLGAQKYAYFYSGLLYIRFSHYVLEFHTNCINATRYFKSLRSIVHRTVLVILVKYHNILYAESISNF